jgi:TRAP-type C4-dicarboxylate transport system permease small subunit
VPTLAKFGLVALAALVLTVLPGGGQALDVALALLTIVFFTAIALVGYRLHRQFRSELFSLTDRQRGILYGSIGLAFLTFCATSRLFDTGGAGVVAWLALLGLASYGVYWVWGRYRAYG